MSAEEKESEESWKGGMKGLIWPATLLDAGRSLGDSSSLLPPPPGLRELGNRELLTRFS